MSAIRIAILGAGGMGHTHAANLAQISPVMLAAICDADANKAAELARQYHARAYSDYDEMLEKESLDAVVICIPPFAHQGQFEKACGLGLHVFIEKPIALTLEQGKSMVAAAQKTGVLTQVGFHMRFGTAVQKIHALTKTGQAGRPILFNGRYQCRSLHSSWWGDVSKSGGQIFEQAIHLYDLGRHLFGNPRTVQARMDNLMHQKSDASEGGRIYR